MNTLETIEGIKKNPRWKTIMIKAEGKDATEFNLEEIMLLNSIVQLETQEESRSQGRRMVELTAKMEGAAEESAKKTGKLAFWTMLLAIATFTLALVTVIFRA